MTFEQLSLIPPILKALDKEGYTTPTPIQEGAIPVILEQKDVFGIAQTGTGKTAAFAIPMIQLLHKQMNHTNPTPRKIKALICTPTRELAIQIGESFASYGRYTDLMHTVIFGGVGQKQQTDKLRRGVDILVATPGRLLDLMQQGFVSLKDIQIFVLDEADRMLDMGFVHDIKRIIAKVPAQRQTLFFSATMPDEILKLANTILKNPVKIEVTPTSSTVDKIDQSIYFLKKENKRDLLVHLLKETSIYSALVFSRTKHGADKIVKHLHAAGLEAQAIHGNKSQNARQKALGEFKAGRLQVLVATDIAARGIDVDHLSHVINFDLPNEPETYVHRIGRTGRAGASGVAMSFCDAEECAYLFDIEKLTGKSIPVVQEHPHATVHAPSNHRASKPKRSRGRGKPRGSFGGAKKPGAGRWQNKKK